MADELSKDKDKKKSDAGLNLLIDPNRFETKFADRVQVESNGDRAVINFIQTIPSGQGQKINAKIISRVALPWPLFGLTAKLFADVTKNNVTRIRDRMDQSIPKSETVNKNG